MASSETPTTFGPYRLVERLGQGGMAQVYRAVAEREGGFERTLVIKRILPQLSSDPRFVKMFLAEARLCARLNHPGIVQVHDVGEVDGEYFLAMEYVEGFDLSRVLYRCAELKRPVPPGLACYIVGELAAALGYAHALADGAGRPLEIVHRDVSPQNVMLSSLGGVKLVDFGIAKARGEVKEERTRTGTLKGKISYMSPEQAEGLQVDRRSDLFALGIVLFECLTIERVFKADNELATLALVRAAKVWPPSSVRPEITPEVDAIALKLLARTPEARYQRGEDAAAALATIAHAERADAAALRRFLDEIKPIARPSDEDASEPTSNQRSPARRRSAGAAAASPSSSSSPVDPLEPTTPLHNPSPPSPAPSPPPPPRSRAALWLGGAAVALLLGGSGGWWLWGPTKQTPSTPASPSPSPSPSPPPSPRIDTRDRPPPKLAHKGKLRLAVVQFRNLTGDKALDSLGEGIGDTVSTGLGRLHDQIKLIERAQIDSALKEIDFGQTRYADKNTATTIGRMTGAEVVIIGGYQRLEGQIRVSARLVSCESGEVLDTLDVTQPAAALLAVQDQVAEALEKRLLAMMKP